MATFKILMPYNFSAHDKKAIQFIINAFGGRDDTRVTLFHTYTPLPDIDVGASPENLKMRSGMNYLTGERAEKEKGLKEAGEILIESGFPEASLNYIFKKKSRTNAEEIAEAAGGGKFDALVLSRKGGKVSSFFTRSIHAKAIAALKNVTICVAV